MLNQLLLALYVIGILLLSLKLKQGTFSGFVISDRNITHPAVIGIAYMAAYFSAASFLGGGGYGLVAGLPWVIWAVFFHVAFACIAFLVAPKIWAASQQYDAKTVPQLLERRYNSQKGKVLLAAIMLLMYTVYLVAIFKGCANLFQGLLGVTYVQGLIIAVIIVALYYVIGGLPAILWISFLQGLIMIVGAVFLYGGLISSGNGMTAIWDAIPANMLSMSGAMVPWQKTFGTAFAISLGLLALPDLLIMLFSAKDKKVVRFAGIYGPISITIYALCIFSLGILAYGAFSQEQLAPYIANPDGLVPFLATSLLPTGFDSIVLLAAISAAMSTMSAIVLVTTTSLTSDILKYFKPETTDDKILKITRIVGVVIIIVSAFFAIDVPQLIVPLVSASMGVIACCVFVPLFFGLYWKRGTSTGFIASLIASFGSIVLWQLFGNPLIHPVFIGLICGTVAYLGGSLASSAPATGTDN
ncbi:sodium:solute symporter family protein [Methanolobus mangrovi]|uniref:Sodium:solute symporter family protein n=1 Tax=Methanolobus mangrovi TaxID=3072977 RepID=A0AA51YKE1_9EURY|nr:sodium:solute symporter family protein [Methanolobus mangrovi]WMW23119.1 sodium:solute symporter family protein [Methanolobus mangrovi]